MAAAISAFMPRAIPLCAAGRVPLQGYGSRTYAVSTEHGKLVVEELPHFRAITGSASALQSYGLLKPEWLPGLTGNSVRRQTVVFAPSGAWLVYGNPRGWKPLLPHMVIVRASAGRYVVEQEYTAEESAIVEAYYDEEWNRRKAEAREEARRPQTSLIWKQSRLVGGRLQRDGNVIYLPRAGAPVEPR